MAHALLRAAATLLSLPLDRDKQEASPGVATRHAGVRAPPAFPAIIARTAEGFVVPETFPKEPSTARALPLDRQKVE